MSMEQATDRPYGIAPPGYRLPAGIRLGRVRLQVADLDRSIDYYTRVLGLRPVEHADGHASLAASGDGEVLVELNERKGAAPAPRGGRPGLYHFAILLPDRPALGRFLAHVARLGERVGASDHLVSEALYLHDPDGLGIEVYADRPRSEWRVRAGELAMATEPLDAHAVMEAAEGRPWEGMPAGTVMGHVHLHVGDLGRADDFYHRALGLDRVVWSYPGALFLSAGGYHHHLGINTWASSSTPPDEDDARLLDWMIILPTSEDLEGALDSLRAAGYPVERDEAGGIATDPWGTRLRLTRRQ